MTTSYTTPPASSERRASIGETSNPIVISSPSPQLKPFKPHQMLMQTPVEIECGPDLSIKLTIHEELLCCHSKLLEERFTKAKNLRKQFEQTDHLRDQIAAHVFPEVTAEEFAADDHEEKALPLIIRAYERFPMPGYGSAIKRMIDDATKAEVQSKRIKARMLQDAIREVNTKVRLTYINAFGLHTITEKLFSAIHRINKKEIDIAKHDVMRAAAQKRILIPDAEPDTFQLVMDWIYQGKLDCEDPQQLYNTLQLATRLGVTALSEFCHSKLYNAANDSIQDALANGTSLKTLLGYGLGPGDRVLEVVFKHAFKDHDAPKRLREMAVNTLASNLDGELWAEINDVVSHSVALQIIAAMVEYHEQVAEGLLNHDTIKHVDDRARTVSPMAALDN
ncbi:hypothetical protein COCMIDRAFT_7494 [Bipolaris oryzae ATCC 44560]|uniref:BTB domain-containing protein n=1 Tax=Bipolaris oryzae ATCC 44560 TaxID=930090 RepID=W6YZL2_COCMI|nr:uncharacterized protein COCMIDRAFT_7494 [Bipolaris oryzae ATCC 44560]EUC43023.1 hypothetical protein COCMIDRAFT_7494 [Bipolaris oryzae ATCC 44560]